MRNLNADSSVDQQARDLFAAHQKTIFIHTDRMFAVLMLLQWLGAIAVSVWLSPKTWVGEYSSISNNVWAAFILGGILSLYPISLALLRPGQTSTRFVIAISQMMMSALLIHLTGGRIETHFHVFGSLAFLSFYRDWRVLVPSTVIVAADHILRGVFWPQSVYGVLVQQDWRWVEHAWWVLFEDVFLFIAIKRSVGEMWDIARRTSEVRQIRDDRELRLRNRTLQLVASNQDLENEIAERRITEEKLKEAEERLQLAFSGSQDAVWDWDFGANKFFYSSRWREMFGWDQEEEIQITPSDWEQFCHPDDQANARLIADVLNKGDKHLFAIEFRHICKDGSYKWVRCRGQGIQSRRGGRLARLVGVHSDISERKEAEKALQKSEERYRCLFDSNPFPMWVFDHDTLRFLAVNDAAISHYGFTREEFLSMDLKQIRPPEQIPLLLENVTRPNTRSQQRRVWVHQKKDGTPIDVEVTSYSLDFDGKPAEIVLANDITDRNRLQAESSVISEIIQGVTTTSKLNDLLELIHRSIGQMLSANNCYVALFDPKTELLNMQFFVDKYDATPAPSKLGHGLTAYIFRKSEPMLLRSEEIRDLTELGEVDVVGTPPAVWLGVPLRTPDGIIGVLVVQEYEDPGAYTERDLVFLTSVGDQIALAIERKRAEEQLQLSNEKLQKSNRELQDFAYVASHDLQEPLRKVQAFSDRLKTRYANALEDEGLDYLERMRSAASRMQLLIQDLLSFSRISTKAQPFVPVNLMTIVKEVLSDLEVNIGETGGTIELGDLPVIDADPLQMRQLLQNLIGNALKFRRADVAPIVSIQARPRPANGNGLGPQYQILVKDNGIGFDEKYTDKIFAVFQRLHGRTEYEGSGVGLAICRKIVERHHGTITAHGKPDHGSTFIVTLPIQQSKVENDQ